MSLKKLILVILCLPIIVHASDEFDDFLIELPVVTSASRLSQSVLSSPSSVTVIDSAMIEASGFIDIADIFRLVPGFLVAHADGGTQAVISHGEGWEYPNRMQLLIDGRSTYTSALSAIDWNTIGIHIEDIDRIEVVRGPAASAYGSNSYAGAINIITKPPELDDKLQLRTRTGNKGEQEWLLRHSGGQENFNYRISASTRKNDGFDDYLDNRELDNISLTSRWILNPINTLWGSFSVTNGEAQMPNLAPELEKGFYDRDREIHAWSTNIRWEHRLSASQELKLNFFHNYLDEDDLTQSYPLSDIAGITPALFAIVTGEPDQSIDIGERTYHSHRSDIELQYSQVFISGLQYVVGAGTRYDTMSSKAFFPMEGEQSNTGYRIFGNIQLPLLEKVTANFGGLYELNRTDRPHFSPRGSLNFHLSPQQSIRTGYSRAYRIPSLLEENMHASMFLDSGTEFDRIYLAAEDLKAEEVTSLDISYLGRLNQWPLSWEFRAYREEYKDTIVFYRDHQTADFVNDYVKLVGNGAESTMYGFEGEVTFRPEKFSFIRLHFNYGHMTGEIISDINQSAPDPATEIRSLENRAPQKSYGILAAKQLGTWQFNLGLYHVGKMKWDGRGDEVDSYNRVDASISKKLALSNKQQLVLKVAGQNITHKDYNEFMEDIDLEFEPRYYASISLIHF